MFLILLFLYIHPHNGEIFNISIFMSQYIRLNDKFQERILRKNKVLGTRKAKTSSQHFFIFKYPMIFKQHLQSGQLFS